jgi:hypothetical protein
VKSSSAASRKLPWNFSAVIRNWIIAHVEAAEIQLLVEASEGMVETPMLCSTVGAAVTVLNWNNDPVTALRRMPASFAPRQLAWAEPP